MDTKALKKLRKEKRKSKDVSGVKNGSHNDSKTANVGSRINLGSKVNMTTKDKTETNAGKVL